MGVGEGEAAVSEGELIEGTLGDGGAKDEGAVEPGLVDGGLGADIDGWLIVGKVVKGGPSEFRLAEGAVCDGRLWLGGRSVVNVPDGRTSVSRVLAG